MQKTKSMAPGFTIVESLVAMAIVATISLAGLGTMTYMRGVKNRSKEICLAHVSGTVEKFRSIGYFAAANNFTPYETNSNFTASLVPPALSLNPRGIADTDMYPSTQILEYPGTAGAPTINNQVLIASSINALLAIYNSNTAFCQAPEGTAYADTAAAPLYQGFGSPSSELGPSAALTLKIESYNTKTGAMDPCTTGLKIAPPGKYEDTDAGSPHYPAFRKATRGAPKDKGLLLTVTQTYNDEEGFPQKCSITQRFQYGADVTPPNPPNYMDLTQTTAPLIIQSSNCPGTNNNYTLTFGYQGVGNEIEPGSVLVCRDASFYPNPITTGQTVTGVVAAQCRGSGRPANFVPAYYGDRQVDVGQTGVNHAGAYPSIDASTSRPWVPCDKVTLCGRTPVNAAIVGTPSQPRYQLRYANLPPLCRAYIQVAAIDTASNSSQPVIGAASDSSHLTPNTSSTFDGMWDIPMARCGQQCGPNTWVPANAVYFQCGGCP